jgi:hypothetical protein
MRTRRQCSRPAHSSVHSAFVLSVLCAAVPALPSDNGRPATARKRKYPGSDFPGTLNRVKPTLPPWGIVARRPG